MCNKFSFAYARARLVDRKLAALALGARPDRCCYATYYKTQLRRAVASEMPSGATCFWGVRRKPPVELRRPRLAADQSKTAHSQHCYSRSSRYVVGESARARPVSAILITQPPGSVTAPMVPALQQVPYRNSPPIKGLNVNPPMDWENHSLLPRKHPQARNP